MTEVPAWEPGPDMRAGAFVGALDRIEAAQKLKVDRKNRLVDPLPEIYWATLEEAHILAQLAQTDEDPARDAGRHMVNRAEQIEQANARGAEAMKRARDRQNGAE